MLLRGCSSSHFIWSIRDGVVEKVHNMDASRRISPRLKKLEEIYQHEDAECALLPLAARETKERNSYAVEENASDISLKEDSLEELTLSQFKKTLKRKRSRDSESVPLKPKEEEDDSDLSEPLCKFKVKCLKRSPSKRAFDNGISQTSSRGTQLVTSEISKDHAAVIIKVEPSELEYFESNHDLKRGGSESFTNEGQKCEINKVSEVECFEVNHDLEREESEPFTNEGQKCETDEVHFEVNHDLKREESEPITKEGQKCENDEISEVECFESNHDLKRGESEPSTNEGQKCGDSEVFEVDYYEVNHDLKRGESEPITNEGQNCENDEVSEVEYFEVNHDMKRGESEPSTNESQPCENDEVSEVEYFEVNHDLKRGESEPFTNEGGKCEMNQSPEEEFFECNHDPKREELESSTNEGKQCESNEVLIDSVGGTKKMEMDSEESIANVNQPPSILSALANDSFLKDPTTGSLDCSQSQLHLQQTPGQVNNISAVQDSDPTFEDEHDEDMVSTDVMSSVSEENQNSTSINVNADSNSLISDDNPLVSKDICARQELLSDPETGSSEVKLDNDDQTGVMSEASEARQPERLPLTRKCISPNSQEKLCHAMKSPDSPDDMDHFKCKEKLYFGEQSEDKFSSTKSDVEDKELNVHPQQATPLTQNKAAISSKHVLKRPRSYKKVSPTKKGFAPKGCLDGPRLCRSLPRHSTGFTSIEGCSENAIAFSQRQMHDIESLASKLMSELNSMKVIVEEKMLYEAYRSPSLKNEADEVKSAIKSATKTEETAKRWLSMMARDCNRFCKIMKLNEDHTSASGDPALSTNQEKPIEREKRKICFADEAGGTLCDIKVYQIEQEPSEQELSLDSRLEVED